MRGLEKDHRGYPIPFIILQDTDNKPHFTMNNHRRQMKCLREKRCAICGSKLDRKLWFVGGPLSAFSENGWYMDTALHYECMAYALQVCPYLALPRYLGRIDSVTLDPAKIPDGYAAILMDHTQIAERPPLFVAVCSLGQEISQKRGRMIPYVRPFRPYVAVEYWQFGVRLPDQEGMELALSQVAKYRQESDTQVPSI
jgi:hypothetical protein